MFFKGIGKNSGIEVSLLCTCLNRDDGVGLSSHPVAIFEPPKEEFLRLNPALHWNQLTERGMQPIGLSVLWPGVFAFLILISLWPLLRADSAECLEDR